jgi:hypothetical protein
MDIIANKLDDIIDDVTDAILQAQGVKYIGFENQSIQYKQVPPDSKPFKKLMAENPLAKGLVQRMTQSDSIMHGIVKGVN